MGAHRLIKPLTVPSTVAFGSSSSNDGKHVRAAFETTVEEQGVVVISESDQQRPEVIGTDKDARFVSGDVFRTWHFRQWRSHKRVQISHVYLPIETFERTGRTRLTASRRVARLHD